jgi:hypothetical protein
LNTILIFFFEVSIAKTTKTLEGEKQKAKKKGSSFSIFREFRELVNKFGSPAAN